MSMFPHKILKLRHRYIFTRGNGLRLRYIIGGFATLFALGATLPQLSAKTPPQTIASDHSATTHTAAQNGHINNGIQNKISSAMRLAPNQVKKAIRPDHKNISIESGQTIAGVLQKSGLSGKESFLAVKALSEHFDPRRVKSGQKITLHYKNDDTENQIINKVAFKLSPVKEILVTRSEDGNFTANLHEKEMEKKTYGRYAEIETSLYGSAARADIPAPVIAEMIRIYSWDVDFQRDIRRGDRVEILYEAYETADGSYSKYGNILYASLDIGGKTVPIYRFEMDNGRVDYFEPDGTSIRKTLMKTPVDGARISSGFGMRKHPVLGYNKMHKGMDFAAPTGTPIYAAGDGVIEYQGRKGAYGNYIRVRHNSKLKTAYAHLSKFQKGLSAGKRVEQGEVIGYIGSTGRSTGPHLHYEVHVNGKQVNPRSVNLPTGETLNGEQLQKFKSTRKSLDQQYAAHTRNQRFAFFRDPDNS